MRIHFTISQCGWQCCCITLHFQKKSCAWRERVWVGCCALLRCVTWCCAVLCATPQMEANPSGVMGPFVAHCSASVALSYTTRWSRLFVFCLCLSKRWCVDTTSLPHCLSLLSRALQFTPFIPKCHSLGPSCGTYQSPWKLFFLIRHWCQMTLHSCLLSLQLFVWAWSSFSCAEYARGKCVRMCLNTACDAGFKLKQSYKTTRNAFFLWQNSAIKRWHKYFLLSRQAALHTPYLVKEVTWGIRSPVFSPVTDSPAPEALSPSWCP